MFRSPALRRNYATILFVAALGYGALLLNPIYARVMTAGLDASWAFGLNYFIHTDLKFGRDFIFTYGPLGFLARPAHIGNNLPVAMAIRFAVWGLVLWQLGRMWANGNRAGASVLLIALAANHVVYCFYWENLAVAAVLILYVRMIREAPTNSEMALAAILTGAIFLLKFSCFVLVALMLFGYTLHVIWRWRETPPKVFFFLVSAWLSGPVAYLIYSPSLANLNLYMRGLQEVSFGYAEAMSLDTAPDAGYRAAAVCLIIAIPAFVALGLRAVGWSAAFIAMTMTWALFRHGFMRSDPQHQASFFYLAPLALAALIALTRLTPKILASYAICFAVLLAVSLPTAMRSWRMLPYSPWIPNLNLIEGFPIFQWNAAMRELDARCAASLKASPVERYKARLEGSRVLMFPFNMVYAAQSNIELFPVYAFQNYEANTHDLDLKSAARLSSASPPVRYVVFEWQSIDGRNPLADDPVFSSTLFSEYAPVEIAPESALLERRKKPLDIVYTPLAQTGYRSGEWVDVPARQTPVAVSLRLTKVWQGAVAAAFYKIPAVFMEVRTASGQLKKFRVPPDVLSSPIVLNQLPFNLQQALAFWQGTPIEDPIVKVRLTGPGLNDFQAARWEFFDMNGMTALQSLR